MRNKLAGRFGSRTAFLALAVLPIGCVIPIPLPPPTVDMNALSVADCNAIVDARNATALNLNAKVGENPLGSDGGLVVVPPAVFVIAGDTDPEIAGLKRDFRMVDELAQSKGCY